MHFQKNGIEWNPSIMDTTGNQHFVSYSEVSDTVAVGVVLCKWAAEHNMAAFSELSSAVHWLRRLNRG